LAIIPPPQPKNGTLSGRSFPVKSWQLHPSAESKIGGLSTGIGCVPGICTSVGTVSAP